jgi:hypothetical protein
MAATGEALLARYQGQSLVLAFRQINPGNPQNLDLFHIVDQGGNILVNVDYTGAVHNPASSPTQGCRIGRYFTSLTTGTTAQFFANVFPNPQSLDLIQVRNVGGNISYYLSYAGVANGS